MPCCVLRAVWCVVCVCGAVWCEALCIGLSAALVLQDVFPLKEVVDKGKAKGKKAAAEVWKER